MRKRLCCSIALMAMGMCVTACGTDKTAVKDSNITTETVAETSVPVSEETSQAEVTENSEKATDDTTEVVSTTEDVLATLADNEIVEDWDFDNVYDVKATINIPEGYHLKEERDSEGAISYENDDGTYMHVYIMFPMSKEDYVELQKTTTERVSDESKENDETTGTVSDADMPEYAYYSLIEKDEGQLEKRFVGFATDLERGNDKEACLIVEFYNFYDSAENHPLEIDELRQYLTNDNIKIEYINK